MRIDRIGDALRALDAEKRAMVELHFWRGVSDEEIAGLLRVDQQEVRRRRQAGVKDLCGELGLEGPGKRQELIERLHSMPDAVWRGDPAPVEQTGGGGSVNRRRRRGALLAAVAGVTSAAVIAAALSGGDDGGEAGESKPDARALGDSVRPTPDASRGARRARFRAVGGDSGRGTAQLVRDGSAPRLLLRVRGLPEPRGSGYVIWLYNSIGDARSIGGSQRGRFRLDAPLPKDASRFRALDISLEASDGIRTHGGDSVLRVSLARLGVTR